MKIHIVYPILLISSKYQAIVKIDFIHEGCVIKCKVYSNTALSEQMLFPRFNCAMKQR